MARGAQSASPHTAAFRAPPFFGPRFVERKKRAFAGNGHRVAGAAARVPDMWRSGGLCSTLAFGSASLTSSMVRHASPPREDRTRPDGRVSSASLAASSGRQAAGSAEASISRVPCKRTPSLTCYFPRNRMLSSMTLRKAIELPQGWEQLPPRYTTTAWLVWRTEACRGTGRSIE